MRYYLLMMLKNERNGKTNGERKKRKKSEKEYTYPDKDIQK